MTSRTDATQVSQQRRAQHAKRRDLEITLMVAAMVFGSVVVSVLAR